MSDRDGVASRVAGRKKTNRYLIIGLKLCLLGGRDKHVISVRRDVGGTKQ
jgi:hypothetical protein